MAANLSPAFWWTSLGDNGAPLSGAQLFFYLTGTSTPAAVYHDAALTTPWTVPAVTDSAGRIVVYLDPALGSLKLIQKDNTGTPVGPTVDPITPTNAGSAGLGEIYVFGGQSNAPVTALAYPSGATFDKLHPGTGVYLVDSATLTSGTYQLEMVGLTDGTHSVTAAFVNLSDGAPDTPLATVSVISATGAIARSPAITFAVPGSTKLYGVKTEVNGSTGFAWAIRLIRTA